ncbi:hypothetical protein D9613_004200 [Agrocybe pediades]|uniref:non-specific serine/threonine protein kinase n=1 Tax=Agrocybe pediades TaxID=84607 RepID=A0A8H4QIT1_9AGAR|nr:hypothetical protein D9613_004200 [Agrocybe pediades]
MAHQQVYQAYPQNKGTLAPGQTISVNNYTVQVERYLSQGGFAHVYLVRTPTPVYNTTHHVLKRIAVANESMLTEVKKEVDIMRLLKGHPNIVHLIDAAWHKLPNGTFEVFILMEFCPGGGIIDMMNRRLRERLTEAEILQIFVDVCEGVAYMHNSRPPLLHRDLKVENILQSSATSFKLCDFGSATTVSNPPTTMQEIRALEADLNRHTTLQYRAPEMVDVYSKRPVNEKSDVWALGVLLYKLCYYTTPFEEHGPLAILNVQYRIPPYPQYSQDMISLIGSMLREHGSQRPTVFELLNHVHRLRGTKSKFSYNVPVPQPLAPRSHAPPNAKPVTSPNPLEGTISYVSPSSKPALSLYDPKSLPNPPAVNAGIQARDKVLEAIGPMRRGRPNTSQNVPSRPSSPQKNTQMRQDTRDALSNWPDANQERAWKNVTEKQKDSSKDADDGWNLKNLDMAPKLDTLEKATGFGDDFSEKLWSAPDPNATPAIPLQPKLSPRPKTLNVTKNIDSPLTPLAYTGTTMVRPKQDRILQAQNRNKDAFEGLGLMTSTTKPPTLGEAVGARKLRTGLASMGMSSYDSGRSNVLPRASPSPQSKFLSPTGATTTLQPKPVSPVPTPNSSNSSFYRSSPYSPSGAGSSPSPATNADGMPIETRFPSLEELDAQFSPPTSNALYPSAVNDASGKYTPSVPRQAGITNTRPQHATRASNVGGGSSSSSNLLKPSAAPIVSHSVDGVRSQQVTGIAMREPKESKRHEERWNSSDRRNDDENTAFKSQSATPSVMRTQQGPTPVKPAFSSGKLEEKTPSETPDSLSPPALPKRPVATTSPKDWLTGEDLDDIKSTTSAEVPILRESPSKRASFIETSDFTIPPFSAAQHVYVTARTVEEPQSAELSPTVSKFARAFPALDMLDTQTVEKTTSNPNSNGLTDSWSPVARRRDAEGDSSSADEGPEDPSSVKPPASAKRPVKGRQSSVHDLVFQYGGRVAPKEKEQEQEKEKEQVQDRKRTAAPQVTGDYKDYKPAKPYKPAGLAPSTNVANSDKTNSSTNQANQQPSIEAKSSPRSPDNQLPVKPQPSANGAGARSPTSARSRPQSMFIFPTKSHSSESQTSNTTLLPPEEPKRATRRTSISDMVQRFEAIGGSAKSPTYIPAGPPSPIHRPVSTKSTSVSNSAGSYKVFPSQNKPIPAKKSISSNVTGRLSAEPPKTTSSSSSQGAPSSQPTGMNRTPTRSHSRKPTVDIKEKPTRSVTPDRAVSRARRMSTKADAPSSSSSPSKAETSVAARTRKISMPAQSLNAPEPARKPVISLKSEEEPSSRADERSPSPERPYQGVGKLIDQWQKKSAEAAQPAVKRDLKRPGVVRGGGR